LRRSFGFLLAVHQHLLFVLTLSIER